MYKLKVLACRWVLSLNLDLKPLLSKFILSHCLTIHREWEKHGVNRTTQLIFALALTFPS